MTITIDRSTLLIIATLAIVSMVWGALLLGMYLGRGRRRHEPPRPLIPAVAPPPSSTPYEDEIARLLSLHLGLPARVTGLNAQSTHDIIIGVGRRPDALVKVVRAPDGRVRRIVLDRLAVAREELGARRAILIVDGPASSDLRVTADGLGVHVMAGQEMARLRMDYQPRYQGVPERTHERYQ